MAQRARAGRGRHRKPRNRNRTRTVGLATAPLVAAVPFALANPAEAATTHTWNRLAQCESGGRWHINTGNGYYGGVQFSDPTWDSNGGGRFASRADLASKSEQITIAERLLDARGWSPWPACSGALGLDRSDAQGHPNGSKASSRAQRNRSHQAASRGKHRAAGGHGVYVVRRGDTLSAIAQAKHVPGGWHRLYRINRDTVGGNPGLIRPGQRLSLR